LVILLNINRSAYGLASKPQERLTGMQGGAGRLWNESFVSAPQLARSPLGKDKVMKDAALMMVAAIESTTSTKSGSVIHVS
jgi:hypothetical protein